MSSLNNVVLLGRLGRDPELKSTPAGQQFCNFSIAVSEKYKDQETTSWIDIVAWGKQAEIISQYLKKGQHVGIQGRIREDKWEKDGEKKRSKLKIILEKFTFIGGGKSEPDNYPAGEEEIPF